MENITGTLMSRVLFSSRRPLAPCLPAVVWHFQKRLMFGVVLVLNATRLTPLKKQRSPCECPKEDSKFRIVEVELRYPVFSTLNVINQFQNIKMCDLVLY